MRLAVVPGANNDRPVGPALGDDACAVRFVTADFFDFFFHP
jgi:hypothetical protein